MTPGQDVHLGTSLAVSAFLPITLVHQRVWTTSTRHCRVWSPGRKAATRWMEISVSSRKGSAAAGLNEVSARLRTIHWLQMHHQATSSSLRH